MMNHMYICKHFETFDLRFREGVEGKMNEIKDHCAYQIGTKSLQNDFESQFHPIILN